MTMVSDLMLKGGRYDPKEIVERYPCIYRLWINLVSSECYCSLTDRWVTLRWCMDCGKRSIKRGM